MATMFKKPKRNFRRKLVSESDSDQENDSKKDTKAEERNEEPMEISGTKDNDKKVKKKKSEKDAAAKIALSFDHDEGDDTEIFQVKKSNHSRRVAKQLKKETLKEKQGDKPASPKLKTDLNNETSHDLAEEQLKKLREEIKTLNGDDDDDDDSDDETGHTFRSMLARGEIPDARTIHMIRKQRQYKREQGDEIIPLEEPVDKSKTARLVRDDEHDRSDDEDEERIDFTINLAAKERQKMRDDFLAAEHGSDNEVSDEDQKEWEAELIRKAVTAVVPLPETASVMDTFTNSYSNHSSIFESVPPSTTPAKMTTFQAFKPMAKMTDPSQITMESVTKRLKDRLESMDEVYRGHKMEYDKLTTNLADTAESIDECDGKSASLEERYRFFQEMRGYVRDLVECLNEKVPIINDLELRLFNLMKTRADKLLQRRQQDVRDQCQDYMTSKTVKVVMGTKEEHAKQRRVAEREARRSRRRRQRESKDIRGHHDGLSSDDEENQSDVSKFTLEKDNIMQVAGQLFNDVVDDFSELECVRREFEKWKFTYRDTYQEAYIGLCLPKLMNPFIRLQLLRWKPLEENCIDFEEAKWYNCLVFLGSTDDEAISLDDDDIKILPAVVDKILIPKLTTMVESVWDPLSTTQTSRLVNLVQKLIKDYPTVRGDSKNTQALLKAAVTRMRKTLDDDVFMPMYPKPVLENRMSGPAVFFHRQSWTCIKLLGNFLSWHGIVSTSVLQNLALDGLLNRYIIFSLHNSFINKEALSKCQTIVSTFPREWFTTGMENTDKTIPQLENLCRYLKAYAESLHKSTMLAKDSERLEAREHIKQISKLLVNIHALDHALLMSNQYSFKLS
ncbi:PAX3- and PAX7-binding protein 1-like [Gigantopelta aegis]|uniref:PAX3- and PAX7-binding protein 1-like n=1 Tax=Gigantopelta aegis TaxID=1735272 RepID=UPI001B889CB7|nr:PAX3- and PAX7-binding protein 1-like [Gigantopelta aegis]